MTIRRTPVVFLFVTVACTCVFPGGSSLAQAIGHPDVLLLYPGATHVWSRAHGIDQLDYHINVKFPAANVITWVSDKLEAAGWKPLRHDFLNPYSNQVHGWQEFVDGPRASTCVHQWIGNWRNSSGGIVRYAFRYERPCKLSDLNVTSGLLDLFVQAVYFPAAYAHAFQEMARQRLKKQK